MKKISIAVVFAMIFLFVAVSGVMAGKGPGGGGGGGGMGGGTTYDAQFISKHFSGSGTCRRCHNILTDSAGQDVSIETGWSSTLMANSTRDPLWRAKVRSELNRNPSLEAVINNKCTKCHAPMGNTEAHYLGDPVAVFGDGFLSATNPHFDEAMDGVSCTFCHQIKDSGSLGTLDGFSGGYEIETFANPVDRLIYGPYLDIFAQPMLNNVQYNPVLGPHIQESKLCAACHNLKTPYVDENGVVLSETAEDEFPEQMPYSEWEHSDYVTQKSCQDCHMTRTDGVVMASRPMWLNTLRDNFAIHKFAGGNKLMLDILNANQDALGVTGNNFAYTLNETDQVLKGAASIELAQSSLVGDQLDFQLRILSHTGHKLPTGIPLRRVILHVTVQDNRGRIVFESGKVNGDGSVEGIDAGEDLSSFQPHYDLINDPGKVQVYEAVMANNLDEVTYTLLRAMDYKKDNRLLPIGFDKDTASGDIRVAGAALNDANFLGGSDDIHFSLAGMTKGRYTIKAELIYQPVTYALVQDLLLSGGQEAATFKSMYDVSGEKSSLLTSLQFDVRR